MQEHVRKRLSALLARIIWFDFTRFLAAMLIFLWGLCIPFTSSMHSSSAVYKLLLCVVAALFLCIFSGTHMVACFSTPKFCIQDSLWKRYAIDVHQWLLVLLDIAFFQYFFEVFVVYYTVGAQYAYSHTELNSPMTEQTMMALLDLRLQDVFCNFMLMKMLIYLIVAGVVGYISFDRKESEFEESTIESKAEDLF